MEQNLDILEEFYRGYRNSVIGFDFALVRFLIRWAILLSCLALGGLLVRYRIARYCRNTLPAQVAIILLAICAAFSVSLDGVSEIKESARFILLNISILTILILPFFLGPLLVRRRGYQKMTVYGLYGLEGILLLIQILVLAWR